MIARQAGARLGVAHRGRSSSCVYTHGGDADFEPHLIAQQMNGDPWQQDQPGERCDLSRTSARGKRMETLQTLGYHEER